METNVTSMNTDVENVTSMNTDGENVNNNNNTDKEKTTVMDTSINNSVKLTQDEETSTKPNVKQPPTSLPFPTSPTSSTSAPTLSASPVSSYYSQPSTPGSSEPSLPSSPVSPSVLKDEDITSEISNEQSRRYLFPLEELNANVSNTTQKVSEDNTKGIQNLVVSSNELYSGVVVRTQYPSLDNDGYNVTSQISLISSPSHELYQNYQATGLGTKLEQLPDNHEYEAEVKQSSKEDRKIWYAELMSVHLSKIYCIAVFMIGVLIYVADTFMKSRFVLAEVFNIYLMVVQIIWLAFVHRDIRKYLQFVSETVSRAQGTHTDSSMSQSSKPMNITASDRYYGFTSGRHSAGGSLYLKAGTTVFFFGYLIWIGLHLGATIQHLDDDSCYNASHVVMAAVEIIHVSYQLFFVFKFSNLIINRWINFSRFGVMHCIATSACLWFYFLYSEILHAIDMQDNFIDSDSLDPPDVISLPEPIHPLNSSTTTVPPEDPIRIYFGCRNSSDIDGVLYVADPYLFPFAIEFNLVIIGLWIAMWQNLGKMEKHTHYPSVLIKTEEDQSKSFYSNLYISVDCHSSNRGLFTGLLTMIFTIIAIIIFYVYTYDESDTEQDQIYRLGVLIRGITEGTLLLVLLITTLIAYSSIKTLDIVSATFTSVDNILLFITLPFIFFFALCNLVSYMNVVIEGTTVPPEEWLFIPVMLLYAFQPVVQTIFINDGLHRCSNSMELQKKKPGREAVTYLIVTNVTMWLFETMQINTQGANKEGLDFYPLVTWQVIASLSMPFSVFFRFHSSACLADIWYYAYEVDA